MITIVKGNSKLLVTKGTFEDQYKNLGYHIASNKEEATKKVASIINKEAEKENNQEKTLEDIKENDKEEENKLNEKYGLKSKKGR